MRLVFHGLENPLDFAPGLPVVLEVENQTLFANLALSLLSGEGRYAREPYSLWEEGGELKPKDRLLVIADPLHLPWDNRTFMTAITKKMEREILEDEELRMQIEEAEQLLASRLGALRLGFHSDYEFGLEWDLKRSLKYFGFEAAFQPEKSFLDNLLNFLSFALDAGCKKTFVFVNLKTFLSENDLKSLYDYVFFSKLSVMLLENKRDMTKYEYERKLSVDLQFLEH